jgi:phosphohistidine phosphatase
VDLILWRHADAEAGGADLERPLTKSGHKQAARVAEWLRKRLPSEFEVVSSPAARALQTAQYLAKKPRIDKTLAPGASSAAILKAAGWPQGDKTVLLVGHQPDFGQAAAELLGAHHGVSIKKGGLWWFTSREREGEDQVVVSAVVSPELL